MNKIKFSLLVFTLLVASCGTPPHEKTGEKSSISIGKSLDSLQAGVSCAHPEAAKIGAEILQVGGNAVDAAVAVQWALAVCFPEAGNLGGGGFMVMRRNDGLVASLDFRERAPVRAFETMYLKPDGEVAEGISQDSRLAAGVPGTVAGIFTMHDKFGTLKMGYLIQPAIELAENGFPITSTQAKRLNENREKFVNRNRFVPAFVKDEPWKEGDLLIQKDLAETLKRIQTGGAIEFYQGKTAELILDEMSGGQGLISAVDLGNYRPDWRVPIDFKFRNYRIISMGPPSSGGIALEQLFRMSEHIGLDTMNHNDPNYIHYTSEIEKRVYADRAEWLGDPDYFEVPYEELTDSIYLRERTQLIGFTATPSSEISAGDFSVVAESEETTHLSVVDEQGNAVSITTTINGMYGGRIVVKGAGFLLNNEMDDFSIKPGTPNAYGLIGGKANAIESGKRMLSSMTPTIVEKDGELFLVAGSPGGSTIITSVYQTIANAVFFDMSLKEAIAVPKFHHQWLPEAIQLEADRFSAETIQELKSRGHKMFYRPSLGRVDAIKISSNGFLEVCGDPRGDDVGAGY